MAPDTRAPAGTWPLVLHIGFAGSRFLFDPKEKVDAASFHDAIQRHLVERLKKLRDELCPDGGHFICGLSQIAIGADTLFSRACGELGWLQRILLPQERESYLSAVDPDGSADFDPAQRDTARALLARATVIQERIVSESPDRETRFREVNLELARLSDVLVCLVSANAGSAPGGTRELIADAELRKRPVLEITVHVDENGRPRFEEKWCGRDLFKLPHLPPKLRAPRPRPGESLDDAVGYSRLLMAQADRTSKWKQICFKASALAIVLTHVLATVIAVIALARYAFYKLEPPPWLVGVELILLVVGLGTHTAMHARAFAAHWAVARLVAEIGRSCYSMRFVTGYPQHFTALPLPDDVRGLIRTLVVLHLRDTSALPVCNWKTRRDDYCHERVTGPDGQVAYYTSNLEKDKRWLKRAMIAFYTGSGAALASTLAKLFCDEIPWLVVLGILLPVCAVAALSLAASYDLEARVHIYGEMSRFLEDQKELLKKAPHAPAFNKFALETETRLLGEVLAWYSRRAFAVVP